MRARPALSLEYFGETAVGKTALPDAAAGAAPRFAAGAAGAAVGAVAVAVASAPHSALRKAAQLRPASVPLVFAAWYLTPHSLSVSACTGDTVTAPDSAATAQIATVA